MTFPRECSTPPRAPSVELRVVGAVIRVASVLAIVAFAWMLAGNNGFGVVQSFGMPPLMWCSYCEYSAEGALIDSGSLPCGACLQTETN